MAQPSPFQDGNGIAAPFVLVPTISYPRPFEVSTSQLTRPIKTSNLQWMVQFRQISSCQLFFTWKMPSPSPGWSKNTSGRCLPLLLRKGHQNHQHPPGPQNRRCPFGKNRGAGSWYTIYHHLPVVKGISSNPSINQPTSGKRTSMLVTS